MTRRIAALYHKIRRRFGREDGVATVEFVLILPAFLMVFMASFESGLLMTRFIMLERAVDMTVRDLRLGIIEFAEDATPQEMHDQVKGIVCDRTVLFSDCAEIMMLELRPVSQTTWEPLGSEADCVDRAADINVVDQFTTGTDNEMMLVRACAVFDPTFPGTGIGLRLPLDDTGGYSLVASSAFVNEPS